MSRKNNLCIPNYYVFDKQFILIDKFFKNIFILLLILSFFFLNLKNSELVRSLYK